ncbi:hypothetical protein MSAN_00180300 [Mycena sanguinolenta]|uniref:Uncharacterized protein n=1 Tax=Mycena sanguinolenta TaxID=230812 RepID=A0A8H7DNE3_9AGAR|nr:hypothetical protein MSAN_00180300 [Mycena sanguinolenta]
MKSCSSSLLLIAAAACVALAAQYPLQYLEHDTWDKDPDVDATGNRIFTSVSELMQLWPGTVVVQGHSFAPCTIPLGTVFYHGRGDEYMPTVPEWLAFDFEHSYFFAWGQDPHVLTLVTKRELRVLDFDGLSAHLSTESQSIIMYGEVRSGGIPTSELAGRLCAWAAKNGIDGFIRMEEHFELIECDFSSSFDLLSSLRIIPQDERTKEGGRFPAQRPEGWIGSLPTDSRSDVDVAGKWHDRAPGETRVRVQYDKFVSFYDPAVTSLVASRRGKPREEQTLKALSKADAQMKLEELETALARPWNGGSGVDWGSIVHVVVERYGERLEVLAHTLSFDSASSYEVAYKARQQVLIMLTSFFTASNTPGTEGATNKTWLTPVVERCASTHTRGLPANDLLTPQEVLIRSAVEDVMQQICRRLARMFSLSYDIELEDKRVHASSVVGAMQLEVSNLMTWLDWTQVWVKCTPACTTEELCLIPHRGLWGGGGDRRKPECVRKPNTL